GEEVSSLILLDSIAPSALQGNLIPNEATEIFEVGMEVAHRFNISLKIDIERLRRSSTQANLQYMIGLFNDHGLELDSQQFAAFYEVYRANILCYRAYTPRMLSRKTEVSLYVAAQENGARLAIPPDYGWNQLLQSPIQIHDVDANHFSILAKV